MELRNVIRKYEGVARKLPRAMTSAHREAHANYKSSFQEIAKSALQSVAASERDAALVDSFVETFTAENSGLVMKFCLLRPKGGNQIDRQITDADVEAWVRAGSENNSTDNSDGKVFDGRDGDVDEVVRKMQGILIYASGNKLQSPQQSARDKYLPYIKQFLSGGISDEKIQMWSKLVLSAWVRHVGATWPSLARRRVRELLRS